MNMKETVLVVDDDQQVREFIMLVLSADGYPVVSAASVSSMECSARY